MKFPTPRDASQTRPWVDAYADAIEEKLAENRHKGDRAGWLAHNPETLLRMLKIEVRELEIADELSGRAGG